MEIIPALIEKDAADLPSDSAVNTVLLYSIAISAKRIADAVSAEGLKGLLDVAASHPMNSYGEGFSDAIQNAHERGLRGINSHG